ncbi:MAG TPA: methyl-accepting chemotaxis protein [Novimethylophilus sp.]|uniref:methyl-accepting chemotaxis protein n=1 Tax=Novimethylophilus sp. TaxID=2137426 RepID=UPI002F41192A
MQASKVGRFDQSFIIHMIRDFFLLLIAVTVIELGVRYGVVVYNYKNHDREAVELATQRLAGDVKSIMLNSGGPVAARTVYPILKRNFEELGLSIGIIPAEVTVTSMKYKFDMEPRGIPPQWPSGKYNEARATLTAEQFCLNCHVHAKVGDVLGEVRVRSYLSTKLTAWWAEVRLSSMIWAINIITHTIVLFLLLKVRMEPLLSLSSTVSSLTKGIIDLSHRAKVKSHDEFGGLALDLNHFLDRIAHIVEDLDKILTKVVATSHRLNQVSHQMNSQFEKIHESTQLILHAALKEQKRQPGILSGSLDALVSALDILSGDAVIPEEARKKLHDLTDRFRDMIRKVESVSGDFPQSDDLLNGLSRDIHEFAHFLGEIALLEEKMQVVAESGQDLLCRLTSAKCDH